MDGTKFDRLVKGLAASTVRREALKASLAGMLAGAVVNVTDDADAKKKKRKKKKKCKKRNVSCTADGQCCGAKQGDIACREHLQTQENCATRFPGRRCCGLEGAACDGDNGSCDCCDDLTCDLADDGQLRCLPAEI